MERAESLAFFAGKQVNIRPVSAVHEELELGEGRSNPNFIADVSAADGTTTRYFVRINGDLPAYGVRRECEQAASRAMAAAGIGPAVLHTEPDALVCDFLPGKTLTEAQLRAAFSGSDGALLDAVGTTLRALHAIPPPAALVSASEGRRWAWAPADVGRWLQLATDASYARLPLLPGAYGLIDALEAEAGPAAAACFCHFDLLPDNLVRDGSRVWLIDCEYAAAGQPLMDLAILAMGSDLSGEEEATLLSAYLRLPSVEAVDASLRRRFAALKLLACLRETMWGVVAEVSGTSALSAEEALAYADKNHAKFVAARAGFEGTYAVALPR